MRSIDPKDPSREEHALRTLDAVLDSHFWGPDPADHKIAFGPGCWDRQTNLVTGLSKLGASLDGWQQLYAEAKAREAA